MTRVLLLGASGQLGREVAFKYPEGVHLSTFTHNELDISSEPELARAITECEPDIIINTAAYTQVDKAESEPEAAFAVNEDAVKHISNLCGSNTHILHLSTDFVFSGHQSSPYLPDDQPEPKSVYGRSKLAGEQVLLENRPGTCVVLRTSWLYGPESRNFLTVMLDLMNTRDELNVVNDQFGSPTSVETLADITWALALNVDAQGIFHWSDRGVITWYDFALEIQQQALDLKLLTARIPINPIPTKGYPTPAIRPEYSALDSSKTEAITGIRTLQWKEQLAGVLARIKQQESNNE